MTALQAMRGIDLVSAATLVAEVGDFRRFRTASELMSFVGLVPSEHSSGGSRRQGRITRTGNGHVRRILVESAWHYRRQPRMSKAIRGRNDKVSAAVRAIAWKAQHRLHKRMSRLTGRGKPFDAGGDGGGAGVGGIRLGDRAGGGAVGGLSGGGGRGAE